MTDRAVWDNLAGEERAAAVAAVWTLIRTLLAWCPGPHAPRSQALPGFRSERQVSCDDCLSRPHTAAPDKACPTCGGRGYHLVHGDRDPMEQPPDTREQRFYEEAFRRREAERARDMEIDRLAQLALVRDGIEASGDHATRMLDHRDRQYKAGDYRPLERALEELRYSYPGLHSVLWQTEVCQQPIMLAPVVRDAVEKAVETIVAPRVVGLVGRPVRVPAWLLPDPSAWRDSLWQGKSERHKQQREERNREIRRLAAEEGWTPARIAGSYGLGLSQVYVILRGRRSAA